MGGRPRRRELVLGLHQVLSVAGARSVMSSTLTGLAARMCVAGGCLAVALASAPASARSGVAAVWPFETGLEHSAFASQLSFGDVKTIALDAGKSLTQLLVEAGATSDEAAKAAAEAARSTDLSRLRPGVRVTVYLGANEGLGRLAGFSLRIDSDRTVSVSRVGDGVFRVRELAAQLVKRSARTAAVLDGGPVLAAISRAGAPQSVLQQVSEALAFEFDLERDFSVGDTIEIVYDRFVDSQGDLVRSGDVQFVRIQTSGRIRDLYRFAPPGASRAEWFDAEGKSARRMLMRTPIATARLTSGFGMRIHPVLGYAKGHTGVDFGAPTGTPIPASGDGEVVRVGYLRGYGNYIKLQHGDGWETAYAHMSRFAPGLREGQRVRQGEVIGFVGSTGRSTGPHLHYEVLRDGSFVNPMSVQLPPTLTLRNEALTAFRGFRTRMDALRTGRPLGPLVAGVGVTSALE